MFESLESVGLIVPSLCMILIGVSNQILFAFILLAVQSSTIILYAVIFQSLLITLVEPEFRARVDSLVIGISAFVMPITILLGGYLADILPVRYIFFVAGGWGILMGFIPLLSKNLRQLNKI